MGNESIMQLSELNAKLQLIMAMETIAGYHTVLSSIIGEGPALAIAETILEDARQSIQNSIADELRRRGLSVPDDQDSRANLTFEDGHVHGNWAPQGSASEPQTTPSVGLYL